MPNYRNSELFSGTEKLLLEYADGMTQTPVEVPDALFAKLREKFTDAQLVELTATLAWENYRARFDHLLQNFRGKGREHLEAWLTAPGQLAIKKNAPEE